MASGLYLSTWGDDAALQWDQRDACQMDPFGRRVTDNVGDPARVQHLVAGASMAGYAGGFLGPLGVGWFLDLAGGDAVLGRGLAFGHLAVVTLAGSWSCGASAALPRNLLFARRLGLRRQAASGSGSVTWRETTPR
jgi:hypothetical protein